MNLRFGPSAFLIVIIIFFALPRSSFFAPPRSSSSSRRRDHHILHAIAIILSALHRHAHHLHLCAVALNFIFFAPLQSSYSSRHRDHLIFIAHRATTLIIFVFTPSRSSSLLHCALISSLRHRALHSLCLWAFCFSVHCVAPSRSRAQLIVAPSRPRSQFQVALLRSCAQVHSRAVKVASSFSSRAIKVACPSSLLCR